MTLFEQMKQALSNSVSSMSQDGGKKKKESKKTGAKKAPAKRKAPAKKPIVRRMKLKRMKGGDMVLTDEATGSSYKCIKQDETIVGAPGENMSDEQAAADITANLLDELKEAEKTGDNDVNPSDSQIGGGKRKVKKTKQFRIKTRMNKKEYKEFLNRKNGEYLKKIAKAHGMKVTTKKNGVTKDIKVDTLRKKMFENTQFLKK